MSLQEQLLLSLSAKHSLIYRLSCLQVTLLAAGRMMYSGTTDDLVPWFESMGFSYEPTVHGLVPDWALDLVSLGLNSSGAAEATTNAHNNGSANKDIAQQYLPWSASQHSSLDCTTRDKDTARLGSVCALDTLGTAADVFMWHLKDQHPEWFESNLSKLPVTVTAGVDALSGDSSHSGALTESVASLDLKSQPPQGSRGKYRWLWPAWSGNAALRRYRALLWREALLTTR